MLSQLKLLGFSLVWQMCLSDIQGCSFPWVLCKLRGEKEPLLPSLHWLQLTYACFKDWLCLVPKTRLCKDVNRHKGLHPGASEVRGGRECGLHTPAHHLNYFVWDDKWPFEMKMPSHNVMSVIHKAFSEATVLLVFGYTYVAFHFKEFPNFLF